MYAMIDTRSDITYAIKKLSQYCQNPSVRHRVALDQVLRYMKGTANLTIVYNGIINPTCYADAVYKDNLTDRKSIYGHTLLIENKAVT